MTMRRTIFWSLVGGLVLLVTGLPEAGDQGKHRGHEKQPATEKSREPYRLTMEALHQNGGVPPGWTFTVPSGQAAAGRQVFIDLECYTCHQVAQETFPEFSRGAEHIGPDLTGMGAHHPGEYFAESIINPNAVIVIGEGYSGPDGLSRMPEYNDVLTVQQLTNLVAYLKSLGGEQQAAGMGKGHHGHGSHDSHSGRHHKQDPKSGSMHKTH